MTIVSMKPVIRGSYAVASNELLLQYFENACARVETMGPRGKKVRDELVADLNELRGLILLRMKGES